MITEITEQEYFQQRMQYMQDLVKQAERAEQAQDVNKVEYLLDVLATEIAPFQVALNIVKAAKGRLTND
ncbi:hypothetical protein CJP72_13215 [Citrobacter sp. NCU1]|uniref:hypothetical protein n=1 Tax=Enterobacteriaceae TaxID=543 RepID=UPI0013920C92|nr:MULTISPECIES: hypothetical protein [Enterobacteriaceae]MDT7053003.1 hypothetical protein [Citrobacter freundii]MED5707304.1 hypothetical protein [Enterobacter hormaechei]NDO81687.1 hypothetical protein [Citrobacter sp. NCU1]